MLGRYLGLDLFNVNRHANHGDELLLLFQANDIPLETVYTDGDKVVSEEMLAMWTDFAKHGDPTPANGKWERVSKDGKDRKHLTISEDAVEMRRDSEDLIDKWK